MKKRKDECQFCSRRKCYNRILRTEEPKYDEVYCYEHAKEAHKACNEYLGVGNGVMRSYINNTGGCRRGDL